MTTNTNAPPQPPLSSSDKANNRLALLRISSFISSLCDSLVAIAVEKDSITTAQGIIATITTEMIGKLLLQPQIPPEQRKSYQAQTLGTIIHIAQASLSELSQSSPTASSEPNPFDELILSLMGSTSSWGAAAVTLTTSLEAAPNSDEEEIKVIVGGTPLSIPLDAFDPTVN